MVFSFQDWAPLQQIAYNGLATTAPLCAWSWVTRVIKFQSKERHRQCSAVATKSLLLLKPFGVISIHCLVCLLLLESEFEVLTWCAVSRIKAPCSAKTTSGTRRAQFTQFRATRSTATSPPAPACYVHSPPPVRNSEHPYVTIRNLHLQA